MKWILKTDSIWASRCMCRWCKSHDYYCPALCSNAARYCRNCIPQKEGMDHHPFLIWDRIKTWLRRVKVHPMLICWEGRPPITVVHYTISLLITFIILYICYMFKLYLSLLFVYDTFFYLNESKEAYQYTKIKRYFRFKQTQWEVGSIPSFNSGETTRRYMVLQFFWPFHTCNKKHIQFASVLFVVIFPGHSTWHL